MKYFIATLVLVACVMGYVHQEEPQLWNSTLMSLRVPENGRAVTDRKDANSADDGDQSEASQSAAKPVPQAPEIISPDSKAYINPDHVHQVEQPADSAAPTNAAPTHSAASAGELPESTAVIHDAAAAHMFDVRQLTATSIPSTFTTLSGKIYTSCVFSSASPDGITFLHATGGAKVKFSDLDSRFGATFGYDPEAARKYEEQEAANDAVARKQEAAADAAAAAAPRTQQVAAVAATSSSSAASPSAKPTLSPMQRQDVQVRIARLQDDVARMQAEKQKIDAENARSEYYTGHPTSVGGNADAIAGKQREIADLQAQLN